MSLICIFRKHLLELVLDQSWGITCTYRRSFSEALQSDSTAYILPQWQVLEDIPPLRPVGAGLCGRSEHFPNKVIREQGWVLRGLQSEKHSNSRLTTWHNLTTVVVYASRRKAWNTTIWRWEQGNGSVDSDQVLTAVIMSIYYCLLQVRYNRKQ